MQDRSRLDLQKEESSSGFLLWGIAGLGAGLAIGLLIAPDKGEKIRQNLKKSVGDGLDHLLESVENSLEKAYEKAIEDEKAGEGSATS